VIGRDRNDCTHGRRSGRVRPDDSRNFPHREYAGIVEELQPLCFVMENVPALLPWGPVHQTARDVGLRVRPSGWMVKLRRCS